MRHVNRKILIVDDEPVALAYTHMLEAHSTWQLPPAVKRPSIATRSRAVCSRYFRHADDRNEWSAIP